MAKPQFWEDERQETTRDLYTKSSITNPRTGRKCQELRCRICSETKNTAFLMENHVRKHTKSRPFMCNICTVAFTTAGNLQRHKSHNSCFKQKRGLTHESETN